MSEYSQAAKATEAINRIAKEKAETTSAVKRDNSNKATVEGFPYEFEARGPNILVAVDVFKSGYECKTCKGTGTILVLAADNSGAYELGPCDDCGGKGALLVFADESKSLPCTGVILSIGKDCVSNPAFDLHLYDRVVFGPHSGRFIPLKVAGVLFKIMHEREATLVITGGDELASFDFVLPEANM
jgi:hypothetical protein